LSQLRRGIDGSAQPCGETPRGIATIDAAAVQGVKKPPRILLIGGSDPSGGAGIQADIKTVTMLGGYAMTAITTITVQNTHGVTAIEPLSAELVTAQIDACLADIGADAVKIGMLGSAAVAQAVADQLAGMTIPIVFDPVMAATNGGMLADAATIAAFGRLMAIATLTTPNVTELAALGGDNALMARAISFLAKGGDAGDEIVTDRLVQSDLPDVAWQASRIHTSHNHGTGCTLASAIATHLGSGMALEHAITQARQFVRSALENAPEFGQGHGPMGHQAVSQM
jgi:hydroxymethylpyrimidine/phosphomethylpyrimidine kinase